MVRPWLMNEWNRGLGFVPSENILGPKLLPQISELDNENVVTNIVIWKK